MEAIRNLIRTDSELRIGLKIVDALSGRIDLTQAERNRLEAWATAIYAYERERWLHKNSKALEMVMEGLRQTGEGKVIDGPDLNEDAKIIAAMDKVDLEHESSH